MSQGAPKLVGLQTRQYDLNQSRERLVSMLSDIIVDGVPLTPEEFGRRSRKSFDVFAKEYVEKECVVTTAEHPEDGMVLLKFQEKTDLRLECEGEWLQEVFREYPREARGLPPEIVPTTSVRGLSGTQRRGHGPIRTIIREAREETRHMKPQLRLKSQDLKFDMDQDLPRNPFDPKNWRRSSVYFVTRCVDVIHRYRVELKKKPWPELVVPENDVIVHHQWVPIRRETAPRLTRDLARIPLGAWTRLKD